MPDSTTALEITNNAKTKCNLVADTTNNQVEIASCSAPGNAFEVAAKFGVSSTGIVHLYGGGTTLGTGVPPILGFVNQTSQNTNQTVIIYTVPTGQTGAYRVCLDLWVTTAASGGTGTPPTINLLYNNGIAITSTVTNATGGGTSLNINTTATPFTSCTLVHAVVGTNISFQTSGGAYGTAVYSDEGSVDRIN